MDPSRSTAFPPLAASHMTPGLPQVVLAPLDYIAVRRLYPGSGQDGSIIYGSSSMARRQQTPQRSWGGRCRSPEWMRSDPDAVKVLCLDSRSTRKDPFCLVGCRGCRVPLTTRGGSPVSGKDGLLWMLMSRRRKVWRFRWRGWPF